MEKLIGIVIGFLVLSLGFAVIERLFAANKEQKIFRRGYRTDLAYWFFTPLVSSTLALVVTAIVLALILQVRPRYIESTILSRQTWATALPLGLQVFLIFFIGDLVGYWTHRLFHGRRLWKYHAIHHSSEDLDWLSSVRLHPVNEVISKTATAAVLIALGFNPKIVAVGVPFFTIYAIALHANVTWGFGWLGYLVTSPRFHRWHHTSQAEGLDKNFAGLFPWIDRIFGTYYMPKDRLPEKFGLYGETIPAEFWGQLMYPFRKKKSAIG